MMTGDEIKKVMCNYPLFRGFIKRKHPGWMDTPIINIPVKIFKEFLEELEGAKQT